MGHDGGAQDVPERWERVTSALTRTCCRHSIEPHLVEARDDSGQTFFAAVWQCPTCGKTTF